MLARDEEVLPRRLRMQVVKNSKVWDIWELETIGFADAFICGE